MADSGIKDEISISVRGLVEFILRSGDIDNTGAGPAGADVMLQGSRIHRKIQFQKIIVRIPCEFADYEGLSDLSLSRNDQRLVFSVLPLLQSSVDLPCEHSHNKRVRIYKLAFFQIDYCIKIQFSR